MMIEAETLKTASAPTLLEMARMIEAKDPYTAGHTWRVANYGQILAAALDYPPEKVEVMLLAGTLHDVGKVMIPDEILTKPGRLTKEEFEIVKKHPQDGFDILKDHEECEAVLEVVLKHHEAYDGKGYPFGLMGEQIPHEARLFAVVDAFDAMTTTRCYRPSMSIDNAVYEIWRNRGRQFDPRIADAFLGLIREGLLDHIAGHADYGVKIGRCPTCGPVLELHNAHHLDDVVVCRVCRSRFEISDILDGEFRLKYVGQATAEEAPAARVAS
ncbi:MAG: HD-GYP domain-containing protein [Planctomycetota bacterium]|nr:HD-GYP domain-containing protein [Planctomycetota bacterium]